MTRSKLTLLVVGLVAVMGAAAVGLALGSGRASDASDARLAHQDAYRAAYDPALRTARRTSRATALEAGLVRGRAAGRRTGAVRGASAGERASDKELAAQAEQSQAAATAAATPEQACGSLLDQTYAYGDCLEQNGQDPGAPLTDYCAAHPEVTVGGFCPSLNE